MDFLRRMGVYRKVHKMHAKGKTIITTRWVDTNKGTKEDPNYRARLVGREIKKDNRLDLFSATPPLETMKVLISECAHGQEEGKRMAVVDVKRAYFYAPTRREIYIKIPEEDMMPGDEDMVGVLDFSLYGTRDAAQNWAHCYTQVLLKAGFIRGRASVCNFHHPSKDVLLTCHGDDFLITGALHDIKWTIATIGASFDIKSDILGPEEGCSREVKILNRTIRWTPTGIEYEPDSKHADLIIRDLKLELSKPVATPGISEPTKEDNEGTLESWQTDHLYRAIAARLNYLSLDRPDLQYASKGAALFMSAPSAKGWARLKRIGKYLIGSAKITQTFPFEKRPNSIKADGDSDWAGQKEDRKSTSGGVLRLGSHAVKTWSSTQNTISLSSAEAELYAMSKAAAQAIGLMQLLQDFGRELSIVVQSDATAAIAIASREGLGRTRHIQVQYLWIQQEVNSGKMKVEKVGTHDNVADLLTKHLSCEIMIGHLRTMHFKVKGGYKSKLQSLCEKTDDRWATRENALICFDTADDRENGENKSGLGPHRYQASAIRCNLKSLMSGVRDHTGTEESGTSTARPEKIFSTTRSGLGPHRHQASAIRCNATGDEVVKVVEKAVEDGCWVRHHQKMRRTKFTPLRVARGPLCRDQAGKWRVTLMRREDSDDWSIEVEDWIKSCEPHQKVMPFIGYTIFID